MYPVSGAFATSMTEYNEDLGQEDIYATVGGMDMKINIQTTTTGFKVQEITGVKNLLATPGTSGEEMADVNYSIEPESGYDYVVKLQGTIDIDFSNSDNSPSITVENNGLSYGHSGIQSKVDSRNFGQKILDFFKNVLGLNKVKDISSKLPSNNNEDENILEENNISSISPGK